MGLYPLTLYPSPARGEGNALLPLLESSPSRKGRKNLESDGVHFTGSPI